MYRIEYIEGTGDQYIDTLYKPTPATRALVDFQYTAKSGNTSVFGLHDFETKARNAIRFLTAGNKVRVVVRFKGREMAHQELGREMLTRFEAAVSSVGTVEKKPVLDGRILSMIVVPQKNTPAKN